MFFLLTALAAVVKLSGMKIMAVMRVFAHQMAGGDDDHDGNNQNFFHAFLLKILKLSISVFSGDTNRKHDYYTEYQGCVSGAEDTK